MYEGGTVFVAHHIIPNSDYRVHRGRLSSSMGGVHIPHSICFIEYVISGKVVQDERDIEVIGRYDQHRGRIRINDLLL